LHSEHNFGRGTLRFLQIWILPDKSGWSPAYGDHKFNWEDRIGRWMPIASGSPGSQAPIKLHADVNVYACVAPEGASIEFKLYPGRQAYLILVEGKARVDSQRMDERDAMELVEEDVTAVADQGASAHFLILEMSRPSQIDEFAFWAAQKELV
jgi:redox-sensitive bicupin YhaK (pirin superfamily)